MSTLTGRIVADFTTSLAAAMAVGATTATLQSATDDDGVALPTGTYYFTLDGSNSSKEHIRCTLTGTALTSIFSVSRQGVATSGCARAHRLGSTVTITDFAHILQINNLVNGTTTLDATVPLGYDGTATISTANQLATKAYADGLAIAGSPDSSTSVKGIGRVSVAPVSAATPIFVGDNDPRVPTTDENDALAGTSGTPSTSNKYVTNDDTATAATASKVARRLASGDVTVPATPTNTTDATSKTYVDTAITTATGNLSFYQQLGLSNNGVTTIATGISMATSEVDGSVMYTVIVGSNTTCYLQRWLKSSTGMYYNTHTVTHSTPGAVIFGSNTTKMGLVVIGTYIYLSYALSTPSSIIRRFDKADLTNDTSITISGTDFDTSTYCPAYTNGTDLIICNTTTTWYRYTISGTTATNAATVTTLSGANVTGSVADASFVYFYDTLNVVYKYSFTGTLSTSGTREFATSQAFYSSGNTSALSLATSANLFVIYAGIVESNTTQVTRMMSLMPITKL